MPTKVYTKPQFKTTQLFQSTPARAKYAKQHGFKWTTWEGSIAAAARLAGQYLANQKLIAQARNEPNYHYPYDATLKLLDEHAVPEIKKTWKTISAVLRKAGIVAAWTIEVSEKNLIDWHLLIREAPAHLMANKGRKIKELIRAKIKHRMNLQFRTIPNAKKAREWCNYIVKAKIAGTKKRKPADTDDPDLVENNTIYFKDFYAKKRRLFVPKSGLNKESVIGKFWETSKADLTKQYKAEQKKKAKAYDAIERAANRLEQITELHPDFIRRRLIKEYLTFPDDKELRKQNDKLGDDWYRTTEDYEDELRYQAEYQAKTNENLDHLLRA